MIMKCDGVAKYIAICKCGSEAAGPVRTRPKAGFVIRCAKDGCPALVQRADAAEAIEAWNEMSTQIK